MARDFCKKTGTLLRKLTNLGLAGGTGIHPHQRPKNQPDEGAAVEQLPEQGHGQVEGEGLEPGEKAGLLEEQGGQQEEGEDAEDALYSLLAELLFIEDYDNIIMCQFSISIDGDRIVCDCAGEKLDRSRMHIKGEIKAVTYHMMRIDPEKPEVTVLFDV